MENQATSTSPIIKEIDGKKMRLTRRFLGEIFPTCTRDSNEKKAYLKGHKYFTHGIDYTYAPPQLAMHEVRQSYFYTN